jgi:hypothetical protein
MGYVNHKNFEHLWCFILKRKERNLSLVQIFGRRFYQFFGWFCPVGFMFGFFA